MPWKAALPFARIVCRQTKAACVAKRSCEAKTANPPFGAENTPSAPPICRKA